jgi:flagellin-like protein
MTVPDVVDDRRGVSGVVGYVLLVGMTVVGLSVVLLAGSALLDDLTGRTTDEATELAAHELDARLGTLAEDGVAATEVSLGRKRPADVRVVDNSTGGHVRLLVNGGQCRATVPLSSVRYRDSSGQEVGYEAGGIFVRADGSSASTVRSPPSVTAANGTLDVSVVDLDGRYDERTVTIRENESRTRNVSRSISEALFDGSNGCRRPSSVTIEVQSDFYSAWASHLESETGVPVATYDGNATARVTLNESWLPESVDDDRNRVVNLTRATGGCSRAEFARGCVVSNGTRDRITVDKSVGNTYTAFARPLGNGTEVTDVRTVKGDVVYRPALDVAFVIDESGSMGWNANTDRSGCDLGEKDGGCQSKREAAQVAARGFVDELNGTKDRVAFVGYDRSARYLRIDGERYFTDDFSVTGVDGAIDDFEAHGGTASNEGVRKANVLFGLKGNASKKRVMILLSDGKNDDDASDRDLFEAAREARNDGIVVYTVGFGSKSYIEEPVLKRTANVTGGEYYYADDASRLDAVFGEIFAKVSDRRVVVHRPVTMQTTVGGRIYRPDFGDDVSYVANVTGPEESPAPNVNDPAAPSPYTFSANAEDGNLVDMTATEYDCEEYELTDRTVVNDTATPNETYRRVRCVDIDGSSGRTVSPTDVSIYLDGESATKLVTETSGWWQADVRNGTLRGHLHDPDGDGTEEFDLRSNQAVVVFEFPSDDGSYDRIVMLYEIGVGTDTTATELIDVRVVSAQIGEESEE